MFQRRSMDRVLVSCMFLSFLRFLDIFLVTQKMIQMLLFFLI